MSIGLSCSVLYPNTCGTARVNCCLAWGHISYQLISQLAFPGQSDSCSITRPAVLDKTTSWEQRSTQASRYNVPLAMCVIEKNNNKEELDGKTPSKWNLKMCYPSFCFLQPPHLKPGKSRLPQEDMDPRTGDLSHVQKLVFTNNWKWSSCVLHSCGVSCLSYIMILPGVSSQPHSAPYTPHHWTHSPQRANCTASLAPVSLTLIC